MSFRTESFINLGPHDFHRIVYYEWGDPENDRVLICAHGWTRNGRDFDHLADALQSDYREICPDLPGRGKSEWLTVKEDYGYPLICADMAALLARLRAERVDWLGTSMGGIVGMLLAAVPNTPVRRLVLNDVGPFISKEALARIAQYVGQDPYFETLEAVEQYLRTINAAFGALTDEQWAHYARHHARAAEAGGYRLAYDPAIALPLTSGDLKDVDFFPVYDAVECPVLLLRGSESDVLLAETAEEMCARGPRAKLFEVTGVGHVPPLMAEDQISVVRDWLLADNS